MTNGDRIRSMTDEQLTEFLGKIRDDGGNIDISGFCEVAGGCKLHSECEECGSCLMSHDDRDDDIKWWLSQEVE